MQVRPRRLLKQLSQRTGTSWFRGSNLILVRDCADEADMANGPGIARDDEDGLGLDFTAHGLRRHGPYFQ